MRNLDIKVILLATLAVFGVDLLTGILLAIYFDQPMLPSTQEEANAAMAALTANGRYLFTTLVLGTASTVFGGWLTARMVQRLPWFNALAFGVLALLLSSLMTGELPLWFVIVALGLTVPAALLGAWLSQRHGP